MTDLRTDNEIREQYRALAEAAVGLSNEGDTAAVTAFAFAVITSAFDLSNPSRRAEICRMSTCELRERVILDDSGIHEDVFAAPYRDEKAGEDVVAVYRRYGAWHGPDYVPGIGDTVAIGGPEHMFRVTKITGNVYRTVQGGERTDDAARVQEIKAIDRVYHPGPTAHFDGRPVIGVGDCVKTGRAQSDW